MRSLQMLRQLLMLVSAFAMTGCLVSEDPVLNSKTGKARPLNEGRYEICTAGKEGELEDCNTFDVSMDENGAYAFMTEGEDPAIMRFRRVGRKAYAVQSAEEDSFIYYFGAGDSKRFLLILMNCADLPPVMRARLIEEEDLTSEDNDFDVCTVNTVRGLTAAAKAYHRNETAGDDPAVVVITPASSE